jgi:DNA-binding winged helix-turn-helix (wHTH) protein/Tol biopolymer transport system component
MAVYEFGDYRFDAIRGQLYRNGQPVELAQRAAPVLECLLQQPGQLLLKQEILDCAWGKVAVAEHSLLEAMKLIRQALGDDAARPTYIKTVRGRGYQFIAEVELVDAVRGPLEVPGVTKSATGPPGADRERQGLLPSTWIGRVAILIVPVVAVFLALLLWWPAWTGLETDGPADGSAASNRVTDNAVADGAAPNGAGDASLLKRFEVALHPRYSLFNFVAVSPNGRLLAYSGRGPGGHHLLVKGIDEVEWKVLEDTDFAVQPSFSPDSREIAFSGLTYPGGPVALQTIDARGGSAREVMVGGRPNFSSWQRDGFIYYSAVDEAGATLRRVASTGGPPEDVFPEAAGSTSSVSTRYRAHGAIQVLPGGVWLLAFSAWQDPVRERDPTLPNVAVCLHRLDGDEERVLIEGALVPRYLSSGHLIYVRNGGLWARRFDPLSGEMGIEEVKLFDVGPTSDIGVSDAGVLLYTDRPQVLGQRPALIDLAGEVREISWPEDTLCRFSALSPDGSRVAAACASRDAPDLTHIRVQEIGQEGIFQRLTPDGNYAAPVWSVDGERLFYSVESEQVWRIESAAIASPGEPDLVWQSGHALWPAAVSPDGSLLAFLELHPETRMDIWMLPLQTGEEARPYLASPEWESGPRFSPDGRWIAYHIGLWRDAEERPNVFVTPADRPRDRIRVSSGDGHWPAWSPDGTQLFYLTPWNQALMAMDVELEAGFRQSVPEILFRPTPMVWTSPPGAMGFDVAPDGDEFLFSVARLAGEPTRLFVVLDLIAELERVLPTKH